MATAAELAAAGYDVIGTARTEESAGRIINVSSVSGRVALPFVGWYAAGKHGLEALGDALRVEIAGFGVHVVLIEPTSYGTPIWERGLAMPPSRDGSVYKRSYDLAALTLARAATLPPPLPVARAVLRALRASRRGRGIVGREARRAVVLDGMMPTRVSDYAKAVATDLCSAPEPLAAILRRLTRRRT